MNTINRKAVAYPAGLKSSKQKIYEFEENQKKKKKLVGLIL